MSGKDYEVVVVGAGVEGSCSAYQLVSKGVKRVLLLEQFHALHSRGSSHGGSRVTRSHPSTECIKEMVTDSADFYNELSRKTGKQLCLPVNVLSFGHKGCPLLKNAADYLRETDTIQPNLSPAEINSRFPLQVTIPQDFECVWESGLSTKLLFPSQIVATLQGLFVSGGGVLLENHCVADIFPGDIVTLRTNRGDFTARKVIITAGGWAPKMLSKLGVDLPLKVQRAEVLYWKTECSEDFTADKYPLMIYENLDTMDKFYVFPEYEYPGMIKVYYRMSREIDPDHRDRFSCGPESVEKVVQFIKTYLKGIATSPSIFEQCVYSLTPDYLPIVDRVPSHPNIMYGAGFSGIGFKLAPAVGCILTEMTLDKPLSFDISPLRLARFNASHAKL